MHLYPIILVAVVLLADEGLAWPLIDGAASPSHSAAWIIGPMIALLLAAWGLTAHWGRALQRGGGPAAAARADRAARLARAAIVAHHALAVLMLGWSEAIRSVTGHLILVDEFLAIAPALMALALTWWIHEPVERRMRVAALIRRLDAGAPVYAMPSRGGYVWLQMRLHVLPLLVPVLAIAGVSEAVAWWVQGREGITSRPWVGDAASAAVAALVLIAAPLLVRPLLDASRLEPGPLRDDLEEICARHRVRAREILIWNTNGLMINAAVMGLFAPLRYVLLTEALVETMSRDEVRAVMGHEIGHIKRRHMPWLLAALLAALAAAALIVEPSLRWWALHQDQPDLLVDARVQIAVLALEAALALAAFGWVSRRFERQADAFAVQHLSGIGEERIESAGRAISREAVAAMCGALDTIARLHATQRRRRSWRHGSIAWRQAFLRSIEGRPTDALAIDGHVTRIKVGIVVVLAVAMLIMFLMNHTP